MRAILLFSMILLRVTVHAQFNTGEKFLGGYLNLQLGQNTSDSFYKTQSVSIAPSMGFMVSEKIAVGGSLGFGSTIQKVIDPDIASKYSAQSYSASFFGQRYYTISDKFLFAVTSNLSFSRNQFSSPLMNPITGEVIYNKLNSYSIGISAKPSLIFFPSPSWGISASLGSILYSYNYSMTNETSSNYFNLSYGTFSTGFFYYFRK